MIEALGVVLDILFPLQFFSVIFSVAVGGAAFVAAIRVLASIINRLAENTPHITHITIDLQKPKGKHADEPFEYDNPFYDDEPEIEYIIGDDGELEPIEQEKPS